MATPGCCQVGRKMAPCFRLAQVVRPARPDVDSCMPRRCLSRPRRRGSRSQPAPPRGVRDIIDAMAESNWLERPIHWRDTGDVFVPYAAESGDHALALRLGDFPAEDMYALLVDGVEVLSFSNWPERWVRTRGQP